MSSRNLYLDPFLIAKSSLAFPCRPCLLEDWVVHDGELDLLINLINLCLQIYQMIRFYSWMIKKLVLLGLFQPRPPWTLEWCRCWDCCGWSWSYHLKLNMLAKNKERRIRMREKPIGSITQVGCFVSSHLTPPAVLSSPMNLKEIFGSRSWQQFA